MVVVAAAVTEGMTMQKKLDGKQILKNILGFINVSYLCRNMIYGHTRYATSIIVEEYTHYQNRLILVIHQYWLLHTRHLNCFRTKGTKYSYDVVLKINLNKLLNNSIIQLLANYRLETQNLSELFVLIVSF